MSITHRWLGTILEVTSDSGTSSCDLKGDKGDIGVRGPQGLPGNGGIPVDLTKYYTKEEIQTLIDGVNAGDIDLTNYYTKAEVNNIINSLESGGSGGGTGGSGTVTPGGGADVDLTNYYTKTELDGKGYQTSSQVNTLIQQALNNIANAEGGGY